MCDFKTTIAQMKYFTIILSSLFSMISFAQKNEDVIVEPEPHKLDEYFKKHNPSGIKKVYIISKNKKTDFTNDTLNVDLYNEDGLKTHTIRYEKNSPASNLQLIYDDNRNLVKSIYTQNKVKERTGITDFKYDNENQLTEEYYKSIFGENIERTVTKKYKYIDKKLVEKTIYQTNNLTQTDSFFYSKNNLTSHKTVYSLGNNDFENTYTYNKLGQLEKKETYSISKDGQKNLFGKATYKYEKDKLISISEIEGKNLLNNEPVLTYYHYGNNGKISKMRVEYKSFYREVDYEYSGQKIISINVITNTENSAYMKFWTSTFGHYIDKMPFTYKEVFDFDDKDNLIRKKILINDELINEVNYIIEYY